MTDINVDIAALANLAKLEISQEERVKLEQQIPSILEFVRTIQSVDVSSVKADAGLRNVTRSDENTHQSGLYTERLMKAAPEQRDNRVVVKQVLSRNKKS